jgi:membrane-bound lytic murein transglycosylase D
MRQWIIIVFLFGFQPLQAQLDTGILQPADTAVQLLKMPEKKAKQPAINNTDSKYQFKSIFSNGPKGNMLSSFGAASNATGINFAHPQAASFVSNYKEGHEKHLNRMKSWGAGYLSLMDGILTQYGVPRQLKYLAVIESNLSSGAVSWAGAAGPWQFMPGTARDYGLQVSGYYDERYDLYKSTHAAAKYLKDLYASLKDWMLVVAAYNGGPGRVYSAISRSGSRDFWRLQGFLPAESRNHVKKFIATQYIMDGSTDIGPLTAAMPMFNPLEKPTVSVDTSQGMMNERITGRYNSLIIAKHIYLDIGSFNAFNPGFDQALSSSSSEYELNLPADKMALFRANRLQIMNESLQLFLTTQTTLDTKFIYPQPPVKKSGGKKRG